MEIYGAKTEDENWTANEMKNTARKHLCKLETYRKNVSAVRNLISL